jgi:SAM-dependent methyltransferase
MFLYNTDMKPWFEDESFWENFAPIMFTPDRWAEVPAVTDGVIRFSHIPASASVLDLCCGTGRITLELARRGYGCTGVDITPSYLKAARESATAEALAIQWVLQDVRTFVRPASYDLALNLYISFGYFDDPADDLLFVQNAFASLRSGGTFIVETLGKEVAVRDFTEGEWFEREGFTVLTEYQVADSWGALKNRWILIKDGERIERTFSQRLYSATELRTLLLTGGFGTVELFGDWDGRPYDQSARILIAVAHKGE